MECLYRRRADIHYAPTRLHVISSDYFMLRVGCEGVGLSGGPQQDRAGISEATYHVFVCNVTTRAVRLAHAKVLWWSNNTYRYDFFGCKHGRGCA